MTGAPRDRRLRQKRAAIRILAQARIDEGKNGRKQRPHHGKAPGQSDLGNDGTCIDTDRRMVKRAQAELQERERE